MKLSSQKSSTGRMLKLAVFITALSCAMSVQADDQVGTDDQILLENKEVQITGKDFEAELARIPAENRTEVLASRDRIRKILEALLISKTMAARARKAGLDHDPGLVRRMELADDKVLAEAQIERSTKEAKIPDFEERANELYRINSDRYTIPEQVHVSHILVAVNKDRTAEDALKRIQEVRQQALDGKSFADLALQYSDDPSAKDNKGDLGFFAAKKMVKPFSDAAFAMNTPGEISEPVKTQFGYHIIQFHERRPEKQLPFDEVKAKIVKELRDKYIADYRMNLTGDIVSDPNLKFNVEAVDHYKTEIPGITEPAPASSANALPAMEGMVRRHRLDHLK